MTDNPTQGFLNRRTKMTSDAHLEREEKGESHDSEIPKLLKEFTDKVSRMGEAEDLQYPFPLSGSDRRLKYDGEDNLAWYLTSDGPLDSHIFVLWNATLVIQKGIYSSEAEPVSLKEIPYDLKRDIVGTLRSYLAKEDSELTPLHESRWSRHLP